MMKSVVARSILLFALLTLTTPALAGVVESPEISEWKDLEEKTTADFVRTEELQTSDWNSMHARVLQKWTDGTMPQPKIYVEYSNHDSTRVKVDFEKGELIAETLITKNEAGSHTNKAKTETNTAIENLVSNRNDDRDAVLMRSEIATQSSHENADNTVTSAAVQSVGDERGADGKTRELFRVKLQLVPDLMKRRAALYRPVVNVWAKKYHFAPAFVLAIIRQESAFNPRARSSAGAIGLMQIVPSSAGREVFKVVKNQALTPTESFLMEPEKNIMMGTTYLQILRDQYFNDVASSQTRQHLMVSSYNWGPARVRKLISRGKVVVQDSAAAVFERLELYVPDETKLYLMRVTRFTQEFQES